MSGNITNFFNEAAGNNKTGLIRNIVCFDLFGKKL